MTRHDLAQLSGRLRRRSRAVVLRLRPSSTRLRPSKADTTARVEHARIPDGETLWLAVDAGAADSLALRDVATGELTPLPTETDPGTGTLRVTRFSLVEDGRPTVSSDVTVVVRPAGGADPVPVTYRRPPATIEQIPRTRSGEHRFELAAVDGTLHIRHRPEPPFATVVRIDATPEIDVRFRAPAGLAPIVMGLDEHGHDMGQIDCDEVGGLLRVRIDLDSLPVPPGGRLDLVVDPTSRVPLKRGHDDLRKPNSAVVLPSLSSDDPDHEPAPYLRYRPDGRLTLACPTRESKGSQ